MKKFIALLLLLPLLFIFVNSKSKSSKGEQKVERIYLWEMETKEEIKSYSNDRTKAKLSLNKKFVIQGKGSLQIEPNGKKKETRVALELFKDKLELWMQTKEVVLNVYIPKGMKVFPNSLYLGMNEYVKGEYIWFDGAFSKSEIKPGWNKVYFVLTDKMTKLKKSNKYKLLLTFSGYDKNNKQVPLKEKFYIDGLYLSGNAGKTKNQLLSKIDDKYKKQVKSMLKMKEDELLDFIQERTFFFFWNEANPKTGLVYDRFKAPANDESVPVSIASVGYALAGIPIAIERGWITKEEGYKRVITTLKSFDRGFVPGKNGFYFHWINMKTAKRMWNSEVSSIDTTIFISGALVAGEYFKDTDVDKLAHKLFKKINWKWMTDGKLSLSMGWKPDKKGSFITVRWNSFNEGLFMYLLSIGSPTYPTKPEYWHDIYRPIRVIKKPKKAKYIYGADEVLFMYQYPQNWVDFRNKEDDYANYFNNAITAVHVNRQYAKDNSKRYLSYSKDIWGISASDGPPRSGGGFYQPYGAVDLRNDGTITPYASIASIPFTPKLSIKTIKAMLKKYGALIWGEYGFTSAFNDDWIWYSQDYIAIDQGNILLMIENYRTGMIWDLFMKNPYIQKGMELVGFKDKKSNYEVTPQYLKKMNK